MTNTSVLSSIVLAGGKGKRFGRDKLSEMIGDRTLLQRVIDRLDGLSSQILVVIAQDQSWPSVPPTSAQIIVDLYPEKGALGGIYTGLVASRSFHSLVVAADMPFLNIPLLRYMIENSPSYDVVIPRIDGALEPLHAIYSKNCLPYMQQQIERDEFKIRNFFEQVKVRYVEQAEIDQLDPQHLSFFNINTLADLRRARKLLQRPRTP
ncbi:MAG: molybdenum cofactor guanylyltransferase [Chloroflexi bacterium]|nr:molybdenum cofactor guanylyltransferase [Chloroflexota bacterium]